MGRNRKDGDPMGLAGTRLSFRHSAFYYRHRDGRWERIGTDIRAAKTRAALYNDPSNAYGTVGYWLDMFLVDCEARVKAKTLAPRTLSDYQKNVEPLKIYFGHMVPEEIKPTTVQGYLKLHAEAGRPVRANREKACLSSCLSWLLRTQPTGLLVNPCMQESGTQNNPESKRERYVTHDEFKAVYQAAGLQVRLMMELTYRTLQRPESDIIKWTPAQLTRDHHGERIIRHRQNKTGVMLKIALSPALAAMIDTVIGTVPVLHQPIVHNRKGEGYTYQGITSMLTAQVARLNLKRSKAGLPQIDSFGFRDLKGKGATDMWQSGIPIEQIQLLCGHSDKATTEKYIKARWSETAQPNLISMA